MPLPIVPVVAQWCLTLCNPPDCSTPGFPVLHYLPEFLKLMPIVPRRAGLPSFPVADAARPLPKPIERWELRVMPKPIDRGLGAGLPASHGWRSLSVAGSVHSIIASRMWCLAPGRLERNFTPTLSFTAMSLKVNDGE